MPTREIDERFLAALEAGMPDASGVALGIDRLMMIALDCEKINDVISLLWTMLKGKSAVKIVIIFYLMGDP